MNNNYLRIDIFLILPNNIKIKKNKRQQEIILKITTMTSQKKKNTTPNSDYQKIFQENNNFKEKISILQKELENVRSENDRLKNELEKYKKKEKEEKEEEERRELNRKKKIPVYFQETASSYPPFSDLERYGIYLSEYDPNTLPEPPLLLYTVFHSARFETVSLDAKKLMKVQTGLGT